VCPNEALASLIYTIWQVLNRCLFTGRADFSFWVVITTLIYSGWADFSFWVVITTLIYYGVVFSFSLLQLGFDQSAKGDLVNYNARHDQSTKGD
jgi:hypothetical protein